MKTLNLFLAVLCLLISNVLYCQEAIPMKGNPEMLKLKDLPSSKLLPFKSPVDFSTIYSSSSLEQSLWIKETFTKEGTHGILSINYEDKYDPRSLDLMVEYGKLVLQFMVEVEIAPSIIYLTDESAVSQERRLQEIRNSYEMEASENAREKLRQEEQQLLEESKIQINNIRIGVAENFKEEVKQFLMEFDIPFQSENLTGKWILNWFDKPDSVMAAIGITRNDAARMEYPGAKRMEIYLREKFESSNPTLAQYLIESNETRVESLDQFTLLIEKHGLPPLKIDDSVTIFDESSIYSRVFEEREYNEEEMEYDDEYLEYDDEYSEDSKGRTMTINEVINDYQKELIEFFGAREYLSTSFYGMIANQFAENLSKGNRNSNADELPELKIKLDVKKGMVVSRQTVMPDPSSNRWWLASNVSYYTIKYGASKIVCVVDEDANPSGEKSTYEFAMKPGLIDIYAFNTYIALSEIKPGFKRTFSLFDVSFFPEQIFGKKDPEPNYLIADVSFVEETQDADNGQPVYKLLVKTQGMTMNPFWLQYIHKSELPYEGFHMYVTKSFPHQVVNIEYSPGKANEEFFLGFEREAGFEYTYEIEEGFEYAYETEAVVEYAKEEEFETTKSSEVTIGTLVWMTKNLDVDKFRNGDLIPQAKTDEEWVKAGESKRPAWCYYKNDPANGAKYGKLYNWYAANDPRGLAPEGWYIPSDAEWTLLTDYLGGANVAGKKMKSTSGWDKDGNGTNESGFTGLSGGARNFYGIFNDIGRYSYWWSSTEGGTSNAWVRYLSYDGDSASRHYGSKSGGYSVRCLRD
jgi:uncharacterized protein (TIGR02145 family)